MGRAALGERVRPDGRFVDSGTVFPCERITHWKDLIARIKYNAIGGQAELGELLCGRATGHVIRRYRAAAQWSDRRDLS